jgi:hypothetical protein
MRKAQINIAGTGADLNIPLGMVPDRVTITNIAKRTGMEISANDGTIGYAIAVGTDGARTDAAATVDFFDGDLSTPAGISLKAAATVNVAGDTLSIEFETYAI